MARVTVGGTSADIVLSSFRFGSRRALALKPNAPLTFWDAKTGGTRHTDLLRDGYAVDSVTADADGYWGPVKLPDGVNFAWVDDGDGTRHLVYPLQAAVDTTTATDLADHEADTSNPHAVTAAQAGAIPAPASPATGDLLRYDGTNWTPAGAPYVPIFGTGDPNGTVDAPIGSTFVNTEPDGWNGARRWGKTTDGGTTGWVVTDGDTGWRDLSSLLLNGWALGTNGHAKIRRIGATVTLKLGRLDSSGATSGAVLNIPAGFSSSLGTHDAAVVAYTNGDSRLLRAQSGQWVIANTSGLDYYGTLVTTADDTPWPSTLPGTA